MYISEYPEDYNLQILQGSVKRYKSMLKDHQDGQKPLFRTRQQIVATKQLKAGRSSSSWFLAGQVRQALMIPPTPGSALAQELRQGVAKILGPDNGTTKIVERGGVPVWQGLRKDDPFPNPTCDFKENCLIGPGCSKTSINYSIACTECNVESRDLVRLEGSRDRSLYLGQSGTTGHRRMRSHVEGIKGAGVLAKHIQEFHNQDRDQDNYRRFKMKVLSTSRTILDRLVQEGTNIANVDQKYPGYLMNSKSEWGKGKLVRFEPRVTRI